MENEMYFHDPIKHSRYLKQALSQNKSRIGFFLAAGCPLAVSMPKDKWPLIPDVASLTTYINTELSKNTAFKYPDLIKELVKNGKPTPNIEEILSFVRTLKDVSIGSNVRGFSSDQLNALEKAICSEISKKVKVELPNLETPYHYLANWIGSVQRDQPIEVFTTNYDLLMEQALEDANVSYFDGFVGSKNSFFDLRAIEEDKLPVYWTRLWKLHGSLNWHKKPDGNITRSTGANSHWDNHIIYPSHLKYDESRKMPFLALADRLNRFLIGRGSALIIAGYSFNDLHLNDCISKSLQSNPSAIVFSLLFDNLDAYPKAKALAGKCSNLSLFAKDKGMIGTTEAEWAITTSIDEVERSIASLIELTAPTTPPPRYSKASHNIGNFDKFAQFLKYLISEDYGGTANAP